jgi:hypothetical protein
MFFLSSSASPANRMEQLRIRERMQAEPIRHPLPNFLKKQRQRVPTPWAHRVSAEMAIGFFEFLATAEFDYRINPIV